MCESAVFVVNAVNGVEVTTARLWARAAELDIARLLFVNMLDRERADFFANARLAQAGVRPARRGHRDPDSAPSGEIAGVIDLLDMKAFRQDAAGRGDSSEIPIPEEQIGARRRNIARG